MCYLKEKVLNCLEIASRFACFFFRRMEWDYFYFETDMRNCCCCCCCCMRTTANTEQTAMSTDDSCTWFCCDLMCGYRA